MSLPGFRSETADGAFRFASLRLQRLKLKKVKILCHGV